MHKAAIYFAALTGCRPSESAYVIARPVAAIRPIVPLSAGGAATPYHQQSLFLAVVPAEATKTKREYKFYIPRSAWGQALGAMLAALGAQRGLPAFGVGDLGRGMEGALYHQLQSSFDAVCRSLGHDAPKAGDSRCSPCSGYNARTLRCYHATRYIRHHTEQALLGLEPYPNPLQHTSIAVTLQRYAATGAADNEAALRRIMGSAGYTEQQRAAVALKHAAVLAVKQVEAGESTGLREVTVDNRLQGGAERLRKGKKKAQQGKKK